MKGSPDASSNFMKAISVENELGLSTCSIFTDLMAAAVQTERACCFNRASPWKSFEFFKTRSTAAEPVLVNTQAC